MNGKPNSRGGRGSTRRGSPKPGPPKAAKPARKSSPGAGGDKPNQPGKLRIIGGDMRGRPVAYHGAEFTRPMKDNIRENLFNILGRAVRGSIVFDMFSGTGVLAIESISRGAATAIAVEQSRVAVRFIRDSCDALGIGNRVQVLPGDTYKIAPRLLKPPQDDMPWIVYLCPPYRMWEDQNDLAALNQMILTTLENAPPGSVLVAETERVFDHSRLPPGNWDLREYGGTRLAFIEPVGACGLDL